jgi:RimJ/RimL family protein N-acetyltransferase
MEIDFRKLSAEDIPLLHQWLNTPHVRRWYGRERDNSSMRSVAEHYCARIDGTQPTRPFVIICDGRLAGYVQTYLISDHSHYCDALALDEDAAGVDVFIGEPACVHRGLGPQIIRSFLRQIVFKQFQVDWCVVGPEPNNHAAIRAYEKLDLFI